ncbi:MAG TPA: MotA/TolQ/ExbB proton channel family protein [Bacteroidia bacterium]|nr:MotA/TolQ/ExbB proton channel family protein [Bacteroidia bacterium]
MNELLIAAIIFGLWTVFSIVFIWKYKHYQTTATADKKSFWNNSYIFDSIPPVFPTLGIFCTALGITFGLSGFDTEKIQESLPTLLEGLRLAFFATMAGIIGLIIFQKINAIIQKQIDDDPNRPVKQTDELSAISALTFEVKELKNDNQKQIEKLIQSFVTDLETKVSSKLSILEKEIVNLQKAANENQKTTTEGLTQINTTANNSRIELAEQLNNLRDEQKTTSEKANKNTDEIIKAMSENNKLTAKKFDEFSELLRKNNTEALVEVMKKATEQFNEQMSELINRLVKENFAELNNSVKSLNDWQKQNKEQVQKLTEQFQKTTEMFTISATTLKQVADNTKSLTDDDSKLSQLVAELKRVMIEDGKFQEITDKLTNTIETLENTTESFDETTSKLNEWVKTEKNFKEAAQILITKLEEFRDFNGDVWDKYRKEMNKAVSIVKETSTRLGGDLENINSEFYERLNDTLTNLDQCIQRFVPTNRR